MSPGLPLPGHHASPPPAAKPRHPEVPTPCGVASGIQLLRCQHVAGSISGILVAKQH